MVICLSMASPCKVPGRKYKGWNCGSRPIRATA
jgi:hypothetical protein